MRDLCEVREIVCALIHSIKTLRNVTPNNREFDCVDYNFINLTLKKNTSKIPNLDF
jgi:hypothetical protein